MELFTQATALAATAVLVVTELLKLVPVEFTSRYPAWVNAVLSFIAAVIVVNPHLDLNNLGATFGTALLIATVAAIAYNQFTSKIVSFTGNTTAK